ncbi:hypothetical protein MED01_001712 [Micromonospora sp. MED01]|uniref:hypothetical protein n=1 Tax=Micromonospora alfalfae TaxID=2911212 RepID=UPI001EE811D8|nr:hypothetical protein [Micromonospora alfalfae]MCG5463559.1 hypothetical protein [Micromonospora alfalfae]
MTGGNDGGAMTGAAGSGAWRSGRRGRGGAQRWATSPRRERLVEERAQRRAADAVAGDRRRPLG